MELDWKIWSDYSDVLLTVPNDLLTAFAPARHCLYEWRSYWVEYPGADRLRVGDTWQIPLGQNLFRVKFKNQLGLTHLQPFAGNTPLCPPLHIEVISRKFASPAQHLGFFRQLLDDIFARAARLPFTFTAPTARGVTETRRPPSDLFVFHFLCQYAPELATALGMILSAPHHRLTDLSEWVPLSQVSQADADVLLEILHAPGELAPNTTLAIAPRLKNHAPQRVWQRQTEETFNTSENRFVLAFLRELLRAAEKLPASGWWQNVPLPRRRLVHGMGTLLCDVIHAPLFENVGPMVRFPANSQVLQRRDGYRELFGLWQQFHHARRPLFDALHHAIDLRDIAGLYEMWVLFVLTEEIGVLKNQAPHIELRLSDGEGLRADVTARFGAHGVLVYNRTWQSYSIPLRPDFSWITGGQLQIVLDAKFRMERLVDNENTESDPVAADVQPSDLYKMHTYRDALQVPSAVAIYPGTQSSFYDLRTGKQENVTLNDVFSGIHTGVGALAYNPLDYSGAIDHE